MPRPKRRARNGLHNGGRSTNEYRRYRDTILNDPNRTHCVICGSWVDKTLPYRDPISGRVDPRSKSLQHTTPLHHGGGLLSGGELAHLGCNLREGHEIATTPDRSLELRDPGRHF